MDGTQAVPSLSQAGTHAFHSTTTHRVFNWVHTIVNPEGQAVKIQPGEEAIDVNPDDVVQYNGVPQKVFLKYIKSEIDEEAAFLSLPCALFLIMSFAFLFIAHDQANVVRDMEDAITMDMQENANFAFSDPGNMGFKGIDDVNSYADFYSWVRRGMRPLLFVQEKVLSEGFDVSKYEADNNIKMNLTTSSKDRQYYLNYNRILGGIRVDQAAAHAEPCDVASLAKFYNRDCYPADKYTSLDLNIEPELIDVMLAHDPVDKELTRWFLTEESVDVIEGRMLEMERNAWFNDRTVRASLNFMTYNGHFNLLTLTSVNFYQTRSGHLWKRITHESLFMHPYAMDKLWLTLVDAIFVAQISWVFLMELWEIFSRSKELCKYGVMGFFQQYIEFWNLVDWISIIMGYCIVLMWMQVVTGTYRVKGLLIDLDPEAQDYIASLEYLNDQFRVVAEFFHVFRYFAAVYPLVIMMRLFKSFAAQPRLALVTRTLASASVDVIHFGIVFLAIFLTYAVMGTALFGRELDGFSTILRSIDTCFAVLMGDFDMDSMNEVGRIMTGFWFWSFMILILLIMLNMLLAIVMDTYTDVRGQIKGSDTLLQQMFDFYRRWNQKRLGQRVSLNHIWKCFHKKFGKNAAQMEDLLDVDAVMQHCDGIGNKQAKRLMGKSVEAVKNEYDATDPLSISEAMGVITKIQIKVHRLKELLDDEARKKNKAAKGDSPGGKSPPMGAKTAFGMQAPAMHQQPPPQQQPQMPQQFSNQHPPHTAGPGFAGVAHHAAPPNNHMGAIAPANVGLQFQSHGAPSPSGAPPPLVNGGDSMRDQLIGKLAQGYSVDDLLRAAWMRLASQTRRDPQSARMISSLLEVAAQQWAECRDGMQNVGTYASQDYGQYGNTGMR